MPQTQGGRDLVKCQSQLHMHMSTHVGTHNTSILWAGVKTVGKSTLWASQPLRLSFPPLQNRANSSYHTKLRWDVNANTVSAPTTHHKLHKSLTHSLAQQNATWEGLKAGSRKNHWWATSSASRGKSPSHSRTGAGSCGNTAGKLSFPPEVTRAVAGRFRQKDDIELCHPLNYVSKGSLWLRCWEWITGRKGGSWETS